MSPRLSRHALLFIATASFLVAGSILLPYSDVSTRVSVASAWLCLLLLSAALLIGPMFMARSGNSPLNSYLRRDVGVWAVINSLIHFWAGTVVSMNQVYIGNFVNLPDSVPSGEIRQQLFNGGSIVGAVVAILFLLLLALSSDRAIRVLGPKRWKSFQKVSIWVLWLTVIHGIAFQVLEGRWAPLVFMTVLAIAVIVLRRTSRRSHHLSV